MKMSNIAHPNMSMTWHQVCTAQEKAETAKKILDDIEVQRRDYTDANLVLDKADALMLYVLAGELPPRSVTDDVVVCILSNTEAERLSQKVKRNLPGLRQRCLHIV